MIPVELECKLQSGMSNKPSESVIANLRVMNCWFDGNDAVWELFYSAEAQKVGTLAFNTM